MIAYKIHCEDDADKQRDPTLCRACIKEHPFKDHGSCYIQNCELMYFMQDCEEFWLVLLQRFIMFSYNSTNDS